MDGFTVEQEIQVVAVIGCVVGDWLVVSESVWVGLVVFVFTNHSTNSEHHFIFLKYYIRNLNIFIDPDVQRTYSSTPTTTPESRAKTTCRPKGTLFKN